MVAAPIRGNWRQFASKPSTFPHSCLFVVLNNSDIVSPSGFRNISNLMASGRRQYPFHLIEPKWRKAWADQQLFRAFNPGEEIPAVHPFGLRHGLAGKTP